MRGMALVAIRRACSRASALSTLPLTLSLYFFGLGSFPPLVDECLEACGLVRRSHAAGEQLRLLKEAQRDALAALSASESARAGAVRLLQAALARPRGTPRTAFPCEEARSLLLIRHSLNAALLSAVCATYYAAGVARLGVERKFLSALLLPVLLFRLGLLLTARRRPFCELLAFYAASFLAGWAAHTLLVAK